MHFALRAFVIDWVKYVSVARAARAARASQGEGSGRWSQFVGTSKVKPVCTRFTFSIPQESLGKSEHCESNVIERCLVT